MDFDRVFLSRLQFAFVITFPIIFPAFTIGLAAWLATIEGARLATGNPLYRRVFDFWLDRECLTLGVMFWPFMIPYTITVASAAAPEASLSFLFYGAGIFALPIVILYTIGVYWIFRGKGHKGYG